MRVVASKCVLESELFLLKLVEKVFVGVRLMLFFVDHGVESRVLGCERFGLCIVHRCHSFRENE